MEITTIGLDLAKIVFQVHAVDAAGRRPSRRRHGNWEPTGCLSQRERSLIFPHFC